MNVLIIGQGGREHCIAWKVLKSSLCKHVFVSPGNPGMELEKNLSTVKLSHNPQSIQSFAKENQVELVVIGPEVPLCEGLVDELEAVGLICFGPNKMAAKLESSKIFSKEIMNKACIATAKYQDFSDSEKALAFIEQTPWQKMVVKLDGLAAGKGVFVCPDKQLAKEAVDKIMVQNLLEVKDQTIIIEQLVTGREVSAFLVCDGENFQFLGYACDYKRIRDNEQGANTGGMGTYSPVDWVSDKLHKNIIDQVVTPTLATMKNQGHPFKGILFIGLMVADEDNFNVLEYNVRLGDPETQTLLALYNDDFLELILNASKAKLPPNNFKVNSQQYAVHVVCSAFGYPGTEGEKVRKGDPISIAKELKDQEDLKIFYAGVNLQDGVMVTSGGRVLGLTAIAPTKEQARQKVYSEIKKIEFKDMHFRRDIAK
jgi:phosphoribosylamine--glycine ligase